MKEKRTHTRKVIGLIAMLIIPIGVGSFVASLVTQFAYPGLTEDYISYSMSHPWPGQLAAAVFSCALALLIYTKRAPKVLGPVFEKTDSRFSVKSFLKGLAIGGAAITAGTLVLAIMGVWRPVGFGSLKGILIGIALGVSGGVAEEVLFRGVVLPLFCNRFSAPLSLLFTSLIFGLIHFGNKLSAAMVIGIFVAAGLLLNGVWFLTRNIWVCIGAHFAWNFFEGGVYGMIVSGIPLSEGGLLRCEMTGSDLLTGGESGPEASLPFVIAIAVVGAVIVYMGLKKYAKKPESTAEENGQA